MAQLVVAAAGAALGGFIAPGIVAFGMTGASLGWMAGSMIGSAFAPTQKSSGPQLSDLSVSTSAYGTPIPYVQGHPRIAGQIVWASTKREIATTQEAGKGGGGSEYTTYTYEVDLLILLTDNEINTVSRVWSNGELISIGGSSTDAWSRMTVYTGSASQFADPTYEAAVGTANAPAYRGRGSVFIQSLQLGSGGQIPNLTFEVLVSHLGYTIAGTFETVGTVASGTFQTRPFPCFVDDDTIITYRAMWDNGYANSTISRSSYTLSTNTLTQLATFTGGLSSSVVSGDGDTGEPYVVNHAGLGAVGYAAGGAYVTNPFRVFIGSATTPWLIAADFATQKIATPEVFLTQTDLYLVSRGNAADAGQGNVARVARGSSAISQFGNATLPAIYQASSVAFMSDGLYVCYTKYNTDPCIIKRFDAVTLAVLESFTAPFGASGSIYRDGPNNLFFISDAGTAGSRVMYRVEVTRAFTPFNTNMNGGSFGMSDFRGFISNGKFWAINPSTAVLYLADNGVQLTEPPIEFVANELCVRSGLNESQFDVTPLAAITKPVRSMAISSVSSARTVLDMLAASYHFEAVLSDKIYFRPRASAPAATLTFNEFGVVVDSGSTPDPLPLTQANELEIPAQMALTYSNVDGDYQTDTQYSDRLLTGQESTSAMQVPLGFTATEAKQIVDAMLLDKAVSALTTSVSLGVTRAALEPTDVVLLTGEDGSSYRMRIVKKAEASGVTTLECVQDDSTVFTQAGTTTGGTSSQTTVLATPTTTLELLDVPLLRDVDNLPGHYVAVKGSAANWTSCGLYDSLDDLTFTPNTTISSQAVIGTCTTTLATWAGGNVFDDVSSVTVNVGTQQLVSVTRDDILASQSTNAALIGGEVLQYRTATLVSAGVYTLGGFLRGQRGTVSTGHVAAERFIVLASGGLRFVPLQQGDLGRLRFYKAASAGQRLSAVTSQSLTPAGITLKPFAPVNARANRNTADTVLTWTRQTRLSTRIVGTLGISSPLGEAAESYEVEIYTAGHAALLRTLTSSTPTVTYTSAQQVTDFGSAPASIAIKVYQISATVGRGTPLITTV